jgi:two-component system NtrC family response regulator
MDRLVKHDYPGNVRELENLIHRAVVLARGTQITTTDLPLHLADLPPEVEADQGSLVERLAAIERGLLVQALEDADGVQTRAARALGIGERHLRYRLRKYGLH